MNDLAAKLSHSTRMPLPQVLEDVKTVLQKSREKLSQMLLKPQTTTPTRLMNLSSEKQQLFERLFKEESEYFNSDDGKPPVEFKDDALLEEYRDWRYEVFDGPNMKEMRDYADRVSAAEAEAAVAVASTMNLSKEKEGLFLRLYRSDTQPAVMSDSFRPAELNDEALRNEFRAWCYAAKVAPGKKVKEEYLAEQARKKAEAETAAAR